MNLSVVIPTYKRHEVLFKTAEQILKQSKDFKELIIVDQFGRPDEGLNLLHKQDKQKKIRYFNLHKTGISVSKNFGLSKATGDIVLFIDDDIVPEKDLIKNHLLCYRDPQVIGVAGRIDEPWAAETDTQLTGRVDRSLARFIKNFAKTPLQEVDFASGANMSFRREAINKIGGFDENFNKGIGFEELDLSLRLKRVVKKRIIYQPKAGVFHLHFINGGTRLADKSQYWYLFYRNYGVLYRNNGQLWQLPVFFLFQAKYFWKNAKLAAFKGFFTGLLWK